jgi:hypothetical protein
VSQALTLFTTPVTYLYMDRFSRFAARHLVGRAKEKSPDKQIGACDVRIPLIRSVRH